MRHLAFAVLVCASCGNKGGSQGLSERTRSFCHDVAHELQSAASDYDGYVAALKTNLTDAQKERYIIDLPYGMSPRERGIAGVALHKRMQFCVYARKGEENALDALSSRANSEVGKLSKLDAPADVAATVNALAKMAEEIDQLPIRD